MISRKDGKIDTFATACKWRGDSNRTDGRRLRRPGVYRWYLSACDGKSYGNLFTEEPVRSLREYFDVFMINAVSENNDFGVGYKTAFSCKLAGKNSTAISGDDASVQVYVGKVVKEEKRKNCLAVVILNTHAYAGTTYFRLSG